ncbi:DUF3560 domain-containing protein [Pedobacter sp. ISL-68]|uniref:DUF3560 domain-containing protein n=1 Tax=unclassified Pedobacter TaxID=2628915 RepID=UPI001BE771E6|nr:MULTISPECIES: DUF3560 domain-containing protein [unclassified Pedobacter]MBT2561327.1 DUF3560 domain-containing protein [Pedobacter sp. ISL-64]MBT2590716.1 DUF3560 domain-containing protein [Pedobacter sp. ISL-68]
MRHDFEERKQNRIENARNQAAKNKKQSNELYNNANKMAAAIPFGQPILVGHHSEKADRSYRNKIHNTYGKAFEKMDKAGYYEDKAEAIENNTAIFSDDPNALEQLQDKLKELEAMQEFMKSANKCVKKKDKEAFLKLPFATEQLWVEINTPDCFRQIGCPAYRLKNNNANIRRIKERIKGLERLEASEEKEYIINGVRIKENTEANRVQIFFPSRLSKEAYKKVRGHGFVWCRSESAFQRQLNNHAVWLAKNLANQYPTLNQ